MKRISRLCSLLACSHANRMSFIQPCAARVGRPRSSYRRTLTLLAQGMSPSRRAHAEEHWYLQTGHHRRRSMAGRVSHIRPLVERWSRVDVGTIRPRLGSAAGRASEETGHSADCWLRIVLNLNMLQALRGRDRWPLPPDCPGVPPPCLRGRCGRSPGCSRSRPWRGPCWRSARRGGRSPPPLR